MIGSSSGVLFRLGRRAAPCLAILALVSSCGGKKAPPPPPVPVTAQEARIADVPLDMRAIGTVEALQSVVVKAQVGGELQKVHFAEGEDVRKGQVLFTLDPRPYEAALRKARAELERDRARSASAQAESKRYADLVAKDYVTRQQYDDAVAEAGALAATVAADEAAVDEAALDLQYCTIRSPINARAGRLYVHEGNLVKANDDSGLVTLNRITPVYAAFTIPEQRLGEVRRFAREGTLRVEARTSDGEARAGVLKFLDNAVNEATGTVLLKAEFPNADRALWPGQFVNVTLTLATRKGAVVVPARAVQPGQKGDYLYVVKDDGTVDMRTVRLGPRFGEEVVLEEGVAGGERVVTDGQLRLVPGAKVDVKAGAGSQG
ncbi:MAG: efflux RND transporter periplasmic adaptor subunit [Acidobacteriota bacterium]